MLVPSFGPHDRAKSWAWALIGGVFVLAFLGLVFLAWHISRPQPGVIIGTTSTTAGAPGTVDIEVREISDSGGLSALQGSIKYDPQLIELKSIAGTNGFVAMAADIDDAKGIARFALVNVGDEGVGSGSIARLLFRAKAFSGNTAPLRWFRSGGTQILLGGNGNEEISSARLVDGKVRIR